jgi:protein required for attachment to host cells
MGLESGIQRIEGQDYNQYSPPARDLVSEKPGRTFDSKGHARHAIEPRVNAHEEMEKAFLAEVVKQLENAFDLKEFDDLVVIAPPRALGTLREILSRRGNIRVVLEIDKDLTRHADDEIANSVREAMKA